MPARIREFWASTRLRIAPSSPENINAKKSDFADLFSLCFGSFQGLAKRTQLTPVQVQALTQLHPASFSSAHELSAQRNAGAQLFGDSEKDGKDLHKNRKYV